MENVKKRCYEMLANNSLVVLNEVDFLQDCDILYHITRHTKANLILLTQKVYWNNTMND